MRRLFVGRDVVVAFKPFANDEFGRIRFVLQNIEAMVGGFTDGAFMIALVAAMKSSTRSGLT